MLLKTVSTEVTQAGVGEEVVPLGVPPSSTSQAGVGVVEEDRAAGLSHLIGRAEGRMAELADLPDVFPGHHPSPPETPTYHALATGVQAQRRRAICFAAGRKDTEQGGDWCETDCRSMISSPFSVPFFS